MTSNTQARRILIKLSGEALAGENGFGIDPDVLEKTASQLYEVYTNGVQISLVLGGGNLFRGSKLQNAGLDRVTGDHMGMLATIMNALALKDALQRKSLPVVVMTPSVLPSITNQYNAHLARELMQTGSIVIVAGGTGAPFFTTDTAAVLRAIELECDEVFKGTKVDGIYTADPLKDKNAAKYDKISYDEALDKKLQVMDLTAFALARENKMPIRVFAMHESGALLSASLGKNIGTLVTI